MIDPTGKPIILGYQFDADADLYNYVHSHAHTQAVIEN